MINQKQNGNMNQKLNSMSTTKSLTSSKNFDPGYPSMNLNQISNRSPFFKKNGTVVNDP
jgi:hypothetical protein